MPRSLPVLQPTKQTLAKYGLTLAEWKSILKSQGGVCAICRRVPPSRRLVVDHFHIRGWKKMKPAERKGYVRGLACFMCNGKCLSRHMTLTRAEYVAAYLRAYEQRQPLAPAPKTRKKV